jgi:uncharacterized protein
MNGAATTTFPILAPAVAAERQPLVVSLHDVAPVTQPVCDRIIRELQHCGVDVCSLLVVPEYHGAARAVDDRAFVEWLRELESAGHEVVIHGYYHRRPRAERENVAAQLLTRLYTQGEGEFYDLPYDQALQRITRARDDFRVAGLQPRGFIAPAWLLSPDGERAARDAEMEYTTRLTTITDLRSGEQFHARSMVYSTRAGWRRALSLCWNGLLSHTMWDAPLLRLSLHPPDIVHHNIWGQITRVLRQFTASRTCCTYADWVAQHRGR